jgi:ATP-dependent Lon protease
MPGKGKLHHDRPARRRDAGVDPGRACTVVRSRAATCSGIEGEFYQKSDIHVHVPEGATPEGRPDARASACRTALVSALTEIPVRSRRRDDR